MQANQLWQKGSALDAVIHRFTVGNDPVTDLALLPYDLLGTAAHVRMLAACGYLPAEDLSQLLPELRRMHELALLGQISISPEQEDCHTAIEHFLSTSLGSVGRSIHLGRSRNDQVLTALRLLLRDRQLQLGISASALARALYNFALQHQSHAMPGYTHLRRAMPSSFGQWALAYAEGIVEELESLRAVLQRLDRCPLGSGAGFGVPLEIDRGLTARLLGFSRVQRSPLDAANSRGRHELAAVGWVAGLGNLLEKLLWDVALFSMEEFGFLKLPDEFTTGSSIMPQKRNPDVVELARGRCAQLRAWRNELEQLASGLPGSYHRDFQWQKEVTLRALDGGHELLDILSMLVPALQVDERRASAACSPEIYSTAEAYRRVTAKGMPFRDAYAAVGSEVLAADYQPGSELASSMDLLKLSAGHESLATDLQEHEAFVRSESARVTAAQTALFA